MTYHISRASERVWTESEEADGLREALLVGRQHGAHHLEVSLRELAPGASTPAHRHPFEESWFVFSGRGRVGIAGLEYEVGAGDYGVAPVGIAHWIRAEGETLSWFSVRAPKPPAFSGAHSHLPAHLGAGEDLGRPSETDPRHRFAGHFREEDLAPFAELSMPGYHGPNIRNISIRMLVDRLLGAQHHTLFLATIAAGSGPGRAAKVHYHPFEEIYYFVAGGMRGKLDGNDEVTEEGDLVWVSTDATHGFVNENDKAARWLEVQSPVPPDSDAFFFPDDWLALGSQQ
jgi:quercetin dioxygenase-like cupin family protein